MGTIAVFFVIIVINVFHTSEEKPIPRWLRRFTALLMKVLCLKGNSCKCSHNKTDTVELKTPVTEFEFGKKPGLTENDVVEVKENEEEDEEMTWTMVSSVLDHFFFVVFMTMVLLSTVVFTSVIVMKYITY